MLSELALWTRQASPTEFWCSAAIALIVGAGLAWWVLVFLNRRRVIEDTPTALIRSAAQGYLELQGHAELMDGDSQLAPVSLRTCVWYSYEIEKRERSFNSHGRDARWKTVESGTSDSIFYLVDPTGRCAIDPDGAAVTPKNDNTWYGNSRVPGGFHATDGRWWARAKGAVGTQSYRYTERWIEPGEELYAIGNFTTHGGAAVRFDSAGALADKLREWKRDQGFLLDRFDANKDGKIDLEEWDQAREQARQQVAAEQHQSTTPPPVDLLSHTGDRRRPFIIHAGSEEQILARYRRYCIGILALSLPIIVVTLWSVALRLGTS